MDIVIGQVLPGGSAVLGFVSGSGAHTGDRYNLRCACGEEYSRTAKLLREYLDRRWPVTCKYRHNGRQCPGHRPAGQSVDRRTVFVVGQTLPNGATIIDVSHRIDKNCGRTISYRCKCGKVTNKTENALIALMGRRMFPCRNCKDTLRPVSKPMPTRTIRYGYSIFVPDGSVRGRLWAMGPPDDPKWIVDPLPPRDVLIVKTRAEAKDWIRQRREYLGRLLHLSIYNHQTERS